MPRALLRERVAALLSCAMALSRKRARQVGIPFEGQPGFFNAITDVAGVEVGHSTIISDSRSSGGREPVVRTGVTAVHPLGKRAIEGVSAGWFALNGTGEMTGTPFLDEYGALFGPVVLTNTVSVGTARDAVIEWSRDWIEDPRALIARCTPVIAETWDGKLNDIYGFHVTKEHVFHALESASSGLVEEGSVGGGTGMTAYDFKAGIGTSSRVVDTPVGEYEVGVLVQANYGKRHQLRVAGVPVGREIPEPAYGSDSSASGDGSIIVIMATNAPMLPLQLKAMSKRASLALGRLGSIAANTSGDIFLSFSTANTVRYGARELRKFDFVPTELLDPFFTAAIEATEEAVVNALVAAVTMTGRKGTTFPSLPHDRLREVLRKYGRLLE